MTTLNVIRTLTIKSTTEGVPESTAALKSLQTAHENVSKVTETSAKHQLSMEKALAQNERRFNSALRAQQDFEKVQKQVNRAVEQNPALQARANDVLRRAAEHFGQASASQSIFARGMQAANDNAQTFASRLGPVGGMLAGLGPAGLVAAAGMGATALAVGVLVKEVNAFADRAGKMVDFAETTGLTTTQLQALQKAAAGVGIDVDRVGTGFERFSVQMEELRRGSGNLFDAMNRIDPALTNQLASTRDLGQAWDVFSVALSRANRELGNAAAKAAFGRTGIPFTRLAGASNEAGGIAGLEAGLGRVNVLTDEQRKRWDKLKDTIDITAMTARDNMLSIFADDVLQGQLKFFETMLAISQIAKTFTISDEMKTLMSWSPPAWIMWAMSKGSSAIRSAATAPQTAPGWAMPGGTATSGGFMDSIRRDMPAGGVAQTPEFEAARMRQRVDILGSAASATLKLALAEAELAIKARAAGVSQEDLRKGLDALKLDNVIALETRRISLLGEMASVDSIVIAKQHEINLARMQGIKITNDEAQAILTRTRIQADAAKLESQLAFERAQMFRSPTDARIADTLRTQGIQPGSARGNNVADMIRFNEQMKIAIDLSSEFATGFVRDMRQGATAIQALTNAMNRLADRLIDMAVNNLVKSALGGLGGSNILGMLGLGGGGGVGDIKPSVGGSIGHSGGIIGQSEFPKRYVHPAYFDDAPRMHGGGMIDWAAGERPFIGQVGERIIPRGGSAGGGVVNNFVIENHGADVEESKPTQNQTGGIDMRVIVRSMVSDDLSSGKHDSVMGGRFGVKPTSARR